MPFNRKKSITVNLQAHSGETIKLRNIYVSLSGQKKFIYKEENKAGFRSLSSSDLHSARMKKKGLQGKEHAIQVDPQPSWSLSIKARAQIFRHERTKKKCSIYEPF